MQNRIAILALGALLSLGFPGALRAQDNATQEANPPQQPAQTQTQTQPRMNRGRSPGMMSPDMQLQRMTKQLNLSTDQQNRIRPILKDRQEKMQALFQDQSLSRQDRRSKMRSIREESTAKIRAVLNDDQKQKYDAIQQRMLERMKERQPGNPPPSSQPQPQ